MATYCPSVNPLVVTMWTVEPLIVSPFAPVTLRKSLLSDVPSVTSVCEPGSRSTVGAERLAFPFPMPAVTCAPVLMVTAFPVPEPAMLPLPPRTPR